MRVFITGGSGLIGSKFVREFFKLGAGTYYTYLSRDSTVDKGVPMKLDVSDRESTMHYILGARPDLVIHCSSITNVDLCETDPKLAHEVNVQGTQNVVDACKAANSKIIFMSSSFVFSGKKEFYTEEDEPDAINVYGRNKADGERIVRESGLPYMIFRTDQPYRWSPKHVQKNNVMRLIGLFEKGQPFKEVVDWYNNPTLVDNLVDVAKRLMVDWEDGIYHTVGSDFVSRYDVATTVADAMGAKRELIVKMSSNDLKLPANRPNVRMSNEKVRKKTGLKMLGIKEGVDLVMQQRKNG